VSQSIFKTYIFVLFAFFILSPLNAQNDLKLQDFNFADNDLSDLKHIEENNIKQLNSFLSEASKLGKIELVKEVIEKGADDFDWAMIQAAENGHMEIVELMITNGAKYFDTAMAWAAENGHMEIVELMITNGAKDFNLSMISAARNGHLEIVELMITNGAKFFHASMRSAKRNGHMEIVKYLKSYSEYLSNLDRVSKNNIKLKENKCNEIDFLQEVYINATSIKQYKTLNEDQKIFANNYRGKTLNKIFDFYKKENEFITKSDCMLNPEFIAKLNFLACEKIKKQQIELTYDDLYIVDEPIAFDKLITNKKLTAFIEDEYLSNYFGFMATKAPLPKEFIDFLKDSYKNPKLLQDCQLLKAWSFHTITTPNP